MALTCLFVCLSAEYGDRPLKLVLKVSGNEVTTGSSSLDTFYEEQPVDSDRPKEKKKKKKKDKERSFGSPEDERGKKKVKSLKTLAPSSWKGSWGWCLKLFLIHFYVRWLRRRKARRQKQMMTGSRAGLLYVQSWINRKVGSKVSNA